MHLGHKAVVHDARSGVGAEITQPDGGPGRSAGPHADSRVACQVAPYQPATSATTWDWPPALKKLTRPSGSTGTTTRLATVWPGAKLRLEAKGRGWPDGNTVRWEPAVGWVTVTFRTTADTPRTGTPPRPVTCSETVPPGPIGPARAPFPVRVSRMRSGLKVRRRAPLPSVPSSNQPATS